MVVTPYFPINNSGLRILPFLPNSGNSLANDTATIIPTKKKFFEMKLRTLVMDEKMLEILGKLDLYSLDATTSAYNAVLESCSKEGASSTFFGDRYGTVSLSIDGFLMMRFAPPLMMENASDLTGRADDMRSRAIAATQLFFPP
jgi:hypothetical protein